MIPSIIKCPQCHSHSLTQHQDVHPVGAAARCDACLAELRLLDGQVVYFPNCAEHRWSHPFTYSVDPSGTQWHRCHKCGEEAIVKDGVRVGA
jgi:predicted RNA-binding Zn-ribbon protein involved in translation (DUF1610 family)